MVVTEVAKAEVIKPLLFGRKLFKLIKFPVIICSIMREVSFWQKNRERREDFPSAFQAGNGEKGVVAFGKKEYTIAISKWGGAG